MPAKTRTIWASRSTILPQGLYFWSSEPRRTVQLNQLSGHLDLWFEGSGELFQAYHLDSLVPFLQIPPGTVSKFEVQENEDGSVLFRRL